MINNVHCIRVYIGSFWDEPLRHDINKKLFDDEERDLFRDLHDLTRNSTLRKLNDLIKRARLVKVQMLQVKTFYIDINIGSFTYYWGHKKQNANVYWKRSKEERFNQQLRRYR